MFVSGLLRDTYKVSKGRRKGNEYDRATRIEVASSSSATRLNKPQSTLEYQIDTMPDYDADPDLEVQTDFNFNHTQHSTVQHVP